MAFLTQPVEDAEPVSKTLTGEPVKEVNFDHPLIQYYTRWQTFRNTKKPLWGANYLQFRVEGRSVAIRAKLLHEGYHIGIVVDDTYKRLPFDEPVRGDQTITIDGLDPSFTHDVRIYVEGDFRFQGLTLQEGAELREHPRGDKLVYFAGDSITDGWIVEEGQESKRTFGHFRKYYSFAPSLAREKGWEYTMFSRGGIGMAHNLNVNQTGAYPERFGRESASSKHAEDAPVYNWRELDPAPDLFCIFLGENDLRSSNGLSREEKIEAFVNSGTAFMDRLRSVYPDSVQYLLISNENTREFIQPLYQRQKEKGNVAMMTLSTLPKDSMADGVHPNFKGHQTWKQEVGAFINSWLGW